MSRVTCQVSHVRCHHILFKLIFFLDKGVELVGGGSVINGPTPFSCSSSSHSNLKYLQHYNFDSFYTLRCTKLVSKNRPEKNCINHGAINLFADLHVFVSLDSFLVYLFTSIVHQDLDQYSGLQIAF